MWRLFMASDQALKDKLRSMWTPEMLDRFETDVRALLQMNGQLTEAEREEIVATLKQKAIDLVAQVPRAGTLGPAR